MTAIGQLLMLWITALLVLVSAESGAGKRFDCQVFCKSTGFSGVVGGCRCSFTLFTAKRADSRVEPWQPPERLVAAAPPLLERLLSRQLRAQGQRELMEDSEFEGKNDLVFGNTYK